MLDTRVFPHRQVKEVNCCKRPYLQYGADFYEFGPFRLDPAGRRLLRDGAPVILTPKVFDTLLVLVEHHGQSLSRSELVARIWPETSVGEHNLNQSIAVLRKVLEDNPRQPDYIATLPGRGYSFIAEVRRAEFNRPATAAAGSSAANGNAIRGDGGMPLRADGGCHGRGAHVGFATGFPSAIKHAVDDRGHAAGIVCGPAAIRFRLAF